MPVYFARGVQNQLLQPQSVFPGLIKDCSRGVCSAQRSCSASSRRLKGRDLSGAVRSVGDVFCLESAHPQMGLGCRFRRAVVTAIMNLFLFFWSKWSVQRSASPR